MVKNLTSGGTWVARSVEHPTSAQVTSLWFIGLSPASGAVLTALTLEPASDAVSPSLSLCSSPVTALSLKINKNVKLKNKKESDFTSGHDLAVCEFKSHTGLCADSSEPGACLRFCVSPSLRPSPAHALCLSLSIINKC